MESYLIFLLTFVGVWSTGSCGFKFSNPSIALTSRTCTHVMLQSSEAAPENATIKLIVQFPETATVHPQEINVVSKKNSWKIKVCGRGAGFTMVTATGKFNNITTTGYLQVIVSRVEILKWVSDIIGWIYFLTWSASFYPQIYENYIRKSVVGLNFDLVALNCVGYALYSVYNCGLYFVPAIQNEYFDLYPRSLSPVLFNDVFYALHAVLAELVMITQCVIYERGNQRVSFTTKSILALYCMVLLVCGALVDESIFTWLDFLYYCSYIKLSVTMIKYIPQVYMNYTRSSTEGWSIGSVWLDLVGGVFSVLQMIVNAYNFDDWDSFFGDPTKFGLGIFSIAFDLIFVYQHYVLYRVTGYEEQVDEASDSSYQTTGTSDTAKVDEYNNSLSPNAVSHPSA